MTRPLWITIDVEAQPRRSPVKPLDRLVWGRFGEGEFGIGRMMDIADSHGVTLTIFLDYAEESLYGNELLDVGREIHRRGHDLQLHLHPEFLPEGFFAEAGVPRVADLNVATQSGADALFAFLTDRHQRACGVPAMAFRGGGYRYNGGILGAMKRHGVRLSSNYNISRATQPMNIGPMPQFFWDAGVIEIPIATVFDFKNTSRHVDYNFNAAIINHREPDIAVERHLAFLDGFYNERGSDAIAVLVMHSWSFLELGDDGVFARPAAEAVETFDRLLTALEDRCDCLTSNQVIDRIDAGGLRCAGPLRFAYVQTQSHFGAAHTEVRRGAARAAEGAAQVTVLGNAPSPERLVENVSCPICGTTARDFADFQGSHRRCPGCGALERQRVFASLYEANDREFDLSQKDVLLVAPSESEVRFLKAQGVTRMRTVDIRPEVKPDIVADICDMPQVADASFDVVIASYVLTHTHDLEACLAEFHRILRPGGWLLTSDPLRTGAPTEEFHDIGTITAWYGREAYDAYRIGTFRAFGELDINQILGKRFEVRSYSRRDAPTGNSVTWFLSVKPNGVTETRQVEDVTAGKREEVAPTPIAAGASLAGEHRGLDLPGALSELRIHDCTFCGDPLQTVNYKGDCLQCGQPSRARSLAPILEHVVSPLLSRSGRPSLPLLAFAMTGAELTLIEPVFPRWKSVSLFGTYCTDHEAGVDARDLSRYDENSFSGVFSIQLFDFFPEHEQALREMYRVMAPGGILFTFIASYRLHDGGEPPAVEEMLKPHAGYFPYWPAEVPLPSATVGRTWFVDAMRRVGFAADLVQVSDDATGETLDWFIGQKPGATPLLTDRGTNAAQPSIEVTSGQGAVRQAPQPSVLPTPRGSQQAASFMAPRKGYSTPVDPAFGFSRVSLRLSLPAVPEAAHDADFAEHVVDPLTGAATDVVIALQVGGILSSEDLGRSWNYRETPESGAIRLWNSFTLASGHRLIQGTGPHSPSDPRDDPQFLPEIFRFDQEWRLLDHQRPGRAQWLGTQSIDQRDRTIIFAEYPENSIKYTQEFTRRQAELEHLCENSRVFRSHDDGVTWQPVLELPWTEIRHFHTVVADPFAPGTWWLTSGDSPSECRIWRSVDDGLSWNDVTALDTEFALQPRYEAYRQSAFRQTAMVVTEDALIWGSDDWLGDPLTADDDAQVGTRVGSRIFVAPKTIPTRPISVAHIGNPVRSITDVGPCYLITTEAKKNTVLARPQIYILSKSAPYLCAEIATIDRFSTAPTGFTYSKASLKAKDGRFFSLRGSNDAFCGGCRIIQWDIDFQ